LTSPLDQIASNCWRSHRAKFQPLSGRHLLVQDYDIPLGASFIEKMHEAVSNSRDLVILFTRDYLHSPYTRKEFTSFEAERAQSQEERHMSYAGDWVTRSIRRRGEPAF